VAQSDPWQLYPWEQRSRTWSATFKINAHKGY